MGRSIILVIAALAVAASTRAAAETLPAGEAAALRGQIEIVRRELKAFGSVTEYAPNVSGEIVSRGVALETGRDACEWVFAIDDVTIKRRVSAPLYRSKQTVPLAAIDPDSIKAHPIRERQWCCARSAEVEFAASGDRQPFMTRSGESWYVSPRVWLAFTDAAAAARAAAALAEAIRLCRRPGA